MPDETRFKAVPSLIYAPNVWFAWYLDKPGGGLFVRDTNGIIVSYASESEALAAAQLSYGRAYASGGFQLELLL